MSAQCTFNPQRVEVLVFQEKEVMPRNLELYIPFNYYEEIIQVLNQIEDWDFARVVDADRNECIYFVNGDDNYFYIKKGRK